MIRPAELIERKRDGEELSADEVRDLLVGFAADDVPDYQMSAFCMAVVFRGLTLAETHALTDAMVQSGETLDLSAALGRKAVDKHSTGGVGDKTSIAVAPLVAACGVPFAKMSGRGLAHTGGTLDKLESIPGFRAELTRDEFIAQVREVGLAVIGATIDLAPADKKLYALRDVTGTVDSIQLIAASIMSKKIAAGAEAIVLDVKVGDGAFMKSIADARVLAETMVELGRRAGREVVCLLTDMDQPLGSAVGNALELREAIATIRGEGPEDFTELVVRIAGLLLSLSDLGIDETEGRARVARAIADGTATAAFERWIRAQGGDPDESLLPTAPVVRPVEIAADGYVSRLGAIAVGRAALHLGAGRAATGDTVDHAVGIVLRRKRGDRVVAGDVLAEVHARDEAAAATAADELLRACELSPDEPRGAGSIVREMIR